MDDIAVYRPPARLTSQQRDIQKPEINRWDAATREVILGDYARQNEQPLACWILPPTFPARATPTMR
jgi:hypothetical protein